VVILTIGNDLETEGESRCYFHLMTFSRPAMAKLSMACHKLYVTVSVKMNELKEKNKHIY
jgi:hypothetical protein